MVVFVVCMIVRLAEVEVFIVECSEVVFFSVDCIGKGAEGYFWVFSRCF